MLVKGRLVVRLPRNRVIELVEQGVDAPFDPGHGRILKEWVAIHDADDADWRSLTAEALDFVGGASAT